MVINQGLVIYKGAEVKKNTKHNILLMCAYILMGLIAGMIYLFIYSIKHNNLFGIVLSCILFCVFLFLLIIITCLRPYKNKKKVKKDRMMVKK